MQPRIRTQAYLVGALPLFFLILLLVVSFLVLRTSLEGSAAEQQTQRILGQADHVQALITDSSRAAGAYGLKHDEALLAPYRAARHNLGGELQKLVAMVADQPGMPARAQRLRALDIQGMSLIDVYVAALRAHNAARVRELTNAPSTRTLGTRLDAAVSDVNNAERQLELSRFTTLRRSNFFYEIALLVLSVLGIAVALFYSGRFGIGIAERLSRLGENAERLAAGVPARPLEGSDEFADLDKVYRAMMLRIAREHRIATTLQHVMLPQALPKMEGVRIDSAYTPAADEAEVGGDWYDVFAINDRCLCISVGDVAGHGLRAATLMAGARFTVRAAARIRFRSRIDHAERQSRTVRGRTGNRRDGVRGDARPQRRQPALHRCRASSAAADLARRRDKLLEGHGFILGADTLSVYETHEISMREGWAMIVYTDGVVEVERNYLEGQKRLVTAARAEYFEPSENIAEAIQNRVLGNIRSHDDSAVLFVGITKLGARSLAPAARAWTLDAREESSTRRVKRALMWHLGEIAAAHSDLAAVELILGELIGNVARHTPGPAEVQTGLRRRARGSACER